MMFVTALALARSNRRRAIAVLAFQSHHSPASIPSWKAQRYMSNNNNNSNNNQYHDVIQSTKSTTVKKIQALVQKRKKRMETGSTIVEGPRMIMDLVRNPNTRPLVQQVIVSSERNDWMEQLQTEHPSLNIKVGTPQVLKACSDTVTPQGIVAIVSIAKTCLDKSKKFPFYLVLDGVADPGNVGTLLRSSVAVGAAGVVLLPQCCDVWNPKAIRSAMGCTFQIPIVTVDSWSDAQHVLLRECNIYAATMEESKSGTTVSIPHYKVDWTVSNTPSALVIGSEGNGLSHSVREAVADGTIQAIHIPMEAGIESLNAAVCGSVILFEYQRQCLCHVDTRSL
jgi:TrmH family RNA methyltransferase